MFKLMTAHGDREVSCFKSLENMVENFVDMYGIQYKGIGFPVSSLHNEFLKFVATDKGISEQEVLELV